MRFGPTDLSQSFVNAKLWSHHTTTDKPTQPWDTVDMTTKGLGHVTEINGGHRSEWGAGYDRRLGRLAQGSGASRRVSRPCVACVSAPQGPERARSRARCVPSLSRQFVEINVSTSLWVQGFRRGYSAASLVFKGVFMAQNTGVPTFSGREAGYLVGAL